MSMISVKVGQKETLSKTVTEHDVYQFAGITGDFAPAHVNKSFVEKTPFGRQVAHGAMLVGFMTSTSTRAVAGTHDPDVMPVSQGFDRIRYIKPVFFGDTITVEYEFTEIDEEKQRTIADVKIRNQQGELNAAATHILRWVTLG